MSSVLFFIWDFCFIFFVCIFFFFFFFFFQAEDGIRDPLVTGVQTCALPIWNSKPCLSVSARLFFSSAWELRSARSTPRRASSSFRVESSSVFVRSEERRVGKECRSRWSAYQ